MTFGYSDRQYEVQEGWIKPPEGYCFDRIPAVAFV